MAENKKAIVFFYEEPDAGKSWLMSSILKGMNVTHIQITEEGQFDWMEAVNKPCIHVGEIVINERNVDLLKKVLSGEAVDVNVKHSAPLRLERKAILEDSNRVSWQFVPQKRVGSHVLYV